MKLRFELDYRAAGHARLPRERQYRLLQTNAYHIFVPQRDVGNLADVLRRVHDTVSLGCFEAET